MENMNGQTCCFIGSKKIPFEKYDKIQKRLEDEIVKLIIQGVRCFRAGCSPGFDTMAGLALLKLRYRFPQIRLVLMLPYRDHTKSWSKKDIKTYGMILEGADEAVYVSDYYYNGCAQKRNRALVDGSRFCVCYLTGASGGGERALGYALKNGLKIIDLAK